MICFFIRIHLLSWVWADGVGCGYHGISSGEALLTGGGVCFGWHSSGEAVLAGVGLPIVGLSFGEEHPRRRTGFGIQRLHGFLWQPFVVFRQSDQFRCGRVAYFDDIEVELIFPGS